MLYLPDVSYLPRYRLLTWPLPEKLVDFLHKRRGLGVYVLPEDEDLAEEIVYKRLRTNFREIPHDGRLAHKTPHYAVQQKAIIFPHRHFWSYYAQDHLLHEFGHAIDYLYSHRNRKLSSLPVFAAALEKIKPLTDYCAITDGRNNNNCEHFASAFSLYFKEPEIPGAQSIDTLQPDLIGLIRKYAILPFEDNNGQKESHLGHSKQ